MGRNYENVNSPEENMRVGPEKKERLGYSDFAKGLAISGIVLMHYSSGLLSGGRLTISQLEGIGVHLFIALCLTIATAVALSNTSRLAISRFNGVGHRRNVVARTLN